MKALTKTDFHFDGQKSVYHGKVRDVYDINDDIQDPHELPASL